MRCNIIFTDMQHGHSKRESEEVQVSVKYSLDLVSVLGTKAESCQAIQGSLELQPGGGGGVGLFDGGGH